jgi:hypothetical protein
MIVHIHIPKNGGSTFNGILQDYLGRERFVEWYPPPPRNIIATPEEEKAFFQEHSNALGIAGHVIRLPLPRVEGVEYQCVTFLRHPAERAVSLYFYERENHARTDPNHRSLQPLESYLRQLAETNAFSIWQCHHLHADATFEAARGLLETFAVVGLVERYDESLVLASHRLGIPLRAMVFPRRNVTRVRPATELLTPEMYRMIVKPGAPDVELYQYARQAFDRQIAAMNRRYYFDMQFVKIGNEALFRKSMIKGYVGGKLKGAMRKSKRLLAKA